MLGIDYWVKSKKVFGFTELIFWLWKQMLVELSHKMEKKKKQLRQMPWSCCTVIHLDFSSSKQGITKRQVRTVAHSQASIALICPITINSFLSVRGHRQQRTYLHLSQWGTFQTLQPTILWNLSSWFLSRSLTPGISLHLVSLGGHHSWTLSLVWLDAVFSYLLWY